MLNFKVARNDFLKCLFLTQGATEKKGSLPILSNLLIETIEIAENKNNITQKEGLIKVSSTDLEISIKDYCPAEIIENGKITINAKKLYSIIKEFPDLKDNKDVIIDIRETDAGLVIISYKKTVFKLTTIPVIDYPTFTDIKTTDNFNIDLQTLKFLINKVIFSTAVNEETKRNLTGVYFVLLDIDGKNILRLVATDGHRLSLAQTEILYKNSLNYNNNITEDLSISKQTNNSTLPQGENLKEYSGQHIYELLKNGIIIPKKILSELIKLIDDVYIDIYINSNNVIFKLINSIKTENGNNTEFISRLIEGKFPDYQSVLPKDNYKNAIVKTKDFIDSIRRVSLLAEEKSHSIELSFNQNQLIIKTVHTSLGEASDEIEVEYNGELINIKLNSRYILDFISNITNEKLKIMFNTIYTPFVIEPFMEELQTTVVGGTSKDNNQNNIERKTSAFKAVYLTGIFMPMRY